MNTPKKYTLEYYDYNEVVNYFETRQDADTRDLWSQMCHIFEIPNGGYVDVFVEISNLGFEWSPVEEGSILSKFLIFYRDNFNNGVAPLLMDW